MRKFKDKSVAPIVAFDFDNTMTSDEQYPECCELRPYAKEVINFLTDIGVKTVIWTCRDSNKEDINLGILHNTPTIDDIAPAIEHLKNNGVRYSAINTSIEFCPFHYNPRKIYAHMYVDDKGLGWRHFGAKDTKNIFIYILMEILDQLLDMNPGQIDTICMYIVKGCVPDGIIEQCHQYVKEFWV